uniref:Molybdenum ABC transporter ATP-binding protein n=1 Tax=Rhodopseudomonas palustris (strain BisA53) TaxID=316055 RepID=Q07IE3_RHOP5
MCDELPEPDPNLVAAISYHSDDDIDSILADFGEDLVRAGAAIGGIVQRNSKNDSGKLCAMAVIDLMTGSRIGISQTLGSGSVACKLDSAGLAEASRAVRDAIEAEVDLIIVNKFSKQEANGRGLRAEIAEAIQSGTPVLTAVPASCMEAWREFTGDRGTTLLCAREVIEAWWREISTRQAVRGIAALEAAAAELASLPRASGRQA